MPGPGPLTYPIRALVGGVSAPARTGMSRTLHVEQWPGDTWPRAGGSPGQQQRPGGLAALSERQDLPDDDSPAGGAHHQLKLYVGGAA